MRNLIMALICLFSFALTNAQDKEPDAFQMTNSSGSFYSISDSIKGQNNFKLGFQWDGHNRIVQSLKMTTRQTVDPDFQWGGTLNSNTIGQNIDVIWQDQSTIFKDRFYSTNFIYKPTIKSDGDFNVFIPPAIDPQNNIWGFRTIK